MVTDDPFSSPRAEAPAQYPPDSALAIRWGYRVTTSFTIVAVLTAASLFEGVLAALFTFLTGLPIALLITTLVTTVIAVPDGQKLNATRIVRTGAICGFLSGANCAALVFGWKAVAMLLTAAAAGIVSGGFGGLIWLELRERQRVRDTLTKLQGRRTQ